MGSLFSNDQTVTSRTKLPSWVESFAKSTLADAGTAASELTPPYQGERVAGINQTQQQAMDAAKGMLGGTDQAFQTAMGGAGNVMGYNPQQVQAQSFLQGNIGQYMSPHTSNVETAAIQQLDDQRKRALNQAADNATAAGAFGGSRHGVMEGVVNTETAKQAGMLSAQLRDQAYRQGMAAMESDFGRNMQAQQLNQAAGLQGAGLNLQGAATYGDLARVGQNAALQGIGAAQGAGNFQQQMAQLGLDTDMARYNELRGYPLEQLDIRLNALGMTPYGSTSTSTRPMSQNPLMSGVGGALAGAQLASSLGYSAGLGGAAGGIASVLPFMFSDEDEKTNKQLLGVDPVTKKKVYAFDYIEDEEEARRTGKPMPPKRVGFMAKDMPPEMVREYGGKKVIANLGFGGRNV